MKTSYIYILSKITHSTLYIGVTSKLLNRVIEHKEGRGSLFTKKYKFFKLVYFEEFSDIRYAIVREKQLKNRRRDWKLELIKSMNPKLSDLFSDLI